jgi:hypothetical protein
MVDNIKMDLKEVRMKSWIGFMWLRRSPVASSYEHGKKFRVP